MAKKTMKKGVKTKKRVSKNISHGQVHIKTSFNNNIVTITDCAGNTLAWSSAGSMGFKSSKKNTPYAAQACVEDAVKKAKNDGITSAEVYIQGPGSGREAAIRALETNGIRVTLIKDVSPIAHNGCKPPKVRRV